MENNSRKIIIDGQEFEIESTDTTDDTHPLDALFDMPPSIMNQPDDTSEQIVDASYDEKDVDLDSELADIARIAKDTFFENKIHISQVEPKYRGEMLNATTNLLNTALQAIKEKAELKKHKDKIVSRQGRVTIGNSENTNIIVADRNTLLEQMRKEKKEKGQ